MITSSPGERHLRLQALVYALMVLLPAAGIARTPGYRIEVVPAGNGVASTSVPCVMQDRSGFIWFGSRYGLEKYDGHGFRSYRYDPFDTTTISDYGLTALAEDSSGGIWSGTIAGGLSRLDRRTGRCIRVHARGEGAARLADDRITALACDADSRLWIGTMSGLQSLDIATSRFRPYLGSRRRGLPEGFPQSVHIDRAGRVWIATCRPNRNSKNPINHAYLSRYDAARDSFVTWPIDSGAGSMRIIGEDADGTLALAWMEVDGPEKPMLYRFGIADGHIRRLDIRDRRRDGLAPTLIPLLVDEDGALWFATMAMKGPASLTVAPCTISRTIPFPYGAVPAQSEYGSLPIPRVETVVEGMPHMALRDRAGTIWLGTREGVVRFIRTGAGITTWRHSESDTTSLSARRIRSIQVDRRGTLWVGTDHGLNRLDPRTGGWLHYFYQTPRVGKLRYSNVNVIYEDPRGPLYFGTNSGLLAYDHVRDTFVDPLPQFRRPDGHRIMVWSLLRDSRGRLWVGTSLDGLALFDSTGNIISWFRHDPSNEGSIPAGGIWSMQEDRSGNIWIGAEEGLCRWEPDRRRFRRYLHRPGDRSSLGGKRIWGLHEDSGGELWIASYGGGLSRYNRKSDDFTTLTTRQGLIDNGVFGLLEDDQGLFWISTSRGIVRWDRGANTFRLFDENDGMQGSEFSYKAFFKGSDGTLYFGGVNGLSAFKPSDLRLNPMDRPLCITAFKVFDSLAANELFDGDTVRLGHTDNFFSFEFTTLDFINTVKARYAYRLDGTNPDWVFTGSDNRVASYTDLEPGVYTFHLRGSNSDGGWNRHEVSVTVIIEPPWWGTIWFRLAAVLLAAGLVAAFIRIRINRIRRFERDTQQGVLQATLKSQEAERQRIARDLHDGVGQMLAAVGVNILHAREIMKRLPGGVDTEPVDASLERSQAILNRVTADVRAISHGLGTSTLREFGLDAALAELLDNLDPRQKTRFEFEMVGMEKRLPDQIETGLFRVAQELIANVLRHAEASEATLQIVRVDREICLTVEDNGIGFDVTAQHHGMGRGNIDARVSVMNGRVHYDSVPGHGTTVMVIVECGEEAGHDNQSEPADSNGNGSLPILDLQSRVDLPENQ